MATTYEKHYIGKGKQVENLDIIRVVIPVENLESAIFTKDDKEYLSFEVAKLQNPDKFGRTHTCYYSEKKQVESSQQESAKSGRKSKKAQAAPEPEPAEDDLPF